MTAQRWGYCLTCRQHRRLHGRSCGRCDMQGYRRGVAPSPALAAQIAQRSAVGDCRNCGGPTVPGTRRRGRCSACRAYLALYGVERPARLWARRDERMGVRPSDYCIVCGARRQRYRRCEACRAYWEKYRVERPRQLWDPPPRVLECWCGVPVFAAVPRRGLCELHYRQDLARRKAAGAPLQGWGA